MPAQKSHGAASFGDLAPKLGQITDEVLFADIWTRPQLSKRDRSLATVAALVAMGRLAQLPFHLTFALENGLSAEELGELMTHLAFYSGWPTAASGVGELARILGEGEG